MSDKIDLRKYDWRLAIVDLAKAVEESQLTNRALAILIADCKDVTMTQAITVLEALPELEQRYLKEEP